jgi:putative redox protein
MKANVTWDKGLSFKGRADSGFELSLGTDPELGGANDGFRPLELMAISLAGCTAMDVISIMVKKKQEVTAFKVNVNTKQAEEFPKVFTQAVITYEVSGHSVEETALLRAIELSATKYCPAQAMLGKVVPMELVYEIYEDEGSGMERLVKQGKYLPQSI